MAQLYPEFELPRWVLSSTGSTSTSLTGNLAGSAAAPVSLDGLIALSTDPETTRKNLQFHDLSLGLGAYAGNEKLRETIATELYPNANDGASVTKDDIIIANATTGANLLVFQAMLERGDHVISLYPTYAQLMQWPANMLGAEVSFWRLKPEKGWELDPEELKALIRMGEEGGGGKGKTKMLVLNNPHNPTGTVMPTAMQAEIVEVCRANDIIIFCDEIFRPLFHSPSSTSTTSFLEHSSKTFDKIITTGSLSKPYGLSGIRIGWVATMNPELRRIMISMRQWTLQSVSVIDEVIAREALSPRCRGPLLAKTLDAAATNLKLLQQLVQESKGRVECRIPAGGGTAFVKFLGEDGKAVDDVAFCHALKDQEGILLAPGSLTFGGAAEGDFRGFVRLHVTAPTGMFGRGVEGLRKFLGVAGVNGVTK